MAAKPRKIVVSDEPEPTGLDALLKATLPSGGSSPQTPENPPPPVPPITPESAALALDAGLSQSISNQPVIVEAHAVGDPSIDRGYVALEAKALQELAPAGPHSVGMANAPPRNVRYESRIRILEAYQYRGTLADAPGWIDRSWIAHADFDPLRGIDAGPALRVPTPRGDMAMVRPGDYVVHQAIELYPGAPPDIQLEVWPRETFERLFIPRPAQDVPDKQPPVIDNLVSSV